MGNIPPMSLRNPKFLSKLKRAEMADEAELFCISASKTVVLARLLVSVNDLLRGLSSSVFRVEQITQNPPLATACRFESGHRHQNRQSSDGFADFFCSPPRRIFPSEDGRRFFCEIFGAKVPAAGGLFFPLIYGMLYLLNNHSVNNRHQLTGIS